MIKKTLYFGNPVYLSLKNAQLVIKLPEVVKNSALHSYPDGSFGAHHCLEEMCTCI